MARPPYSLEEACRKLATDADGIRKLVRDGSLREFRDAGKVFYKAEDIDKLASAGGGPAGLSGTGEIVLEPAEEEVPSISDTSGGTSIIGLASMDEDEPAKKKEDTVITASGIGVFDDEDLEIDADPLAKTQVTTGPSTDQVSLEGTGSGSGLLDLTREADDTSLGAELLDEIYPGEDEQTPAPAKPRAAERPAPEPEPEAEVEEEAAPVDRGETLIPVIVPTADPWEGIAGGALVGALAALAVGGSVVGGVLQGYLPDYARLFSNNFLAFIGGAFGVLIVTTGIGWLTTRMGTGKPRKARVKA